MKLLRLRSGPSRCAQADVPALGLMVQKRGGEPEIAVAGVRIAGTEVQVTANDAWHWGSITKSMTATVVARLVEREVVAWDDTIEKWLGEKVPGMHDAYREATFTHLLAHQSGMQANIPITRFGEFQRQPDDVIADRLAWVKIALSQDPLAKPGEQYAYSNNGYIVAGAMLEAATGKPWEQLMREELFEPLELNGAGFGAPAHREPEKGPVRQPRGHVPRDGRDVPAPPDADNPPALGPAGRVHMPLADMARYLRAHASRDESYLSSESWEKLHTQPFGGFYALGWLVITPTARLHNGSNTMWYAEVVFDSDSGTAAAVVVNDGDIEGVSPYVRKLLQDLMQREEPGADDRSSDVERDLEG